MMDFMRQKDLINMDKLSQIGVTVIGAGAVGSFSALTIAKMGVNRMEVYDEDGVSEHNLPNQFYREKDIKQFKVEALGDVLRDFCGVSITENIAFYTDQRLSDVVVVATDSMASRKQVWEQFKKQEQCRVYIEARMGGEFGLVYMLRKCSLGGHTDLGLEIKDIEFYEERLYPDSKVKPLPCTARTIIYNVLVIAAMIARALKSIVNEEKFPREMVFNVRDINKFSFMVRE
jgi:molybdopterin/thiamine biosynthesis adenylyltransferase